jgi:predicted NodU family carbamoyl transferase
MPSVESPGDAIRLFFESGMDALVLGLFLCDKNERDTLFGRAA